MNIEYKSSDNPRIIAIQKIYSHFLYQDSIIDLGLSPALTLKARITLIRNVGKGVGVSYGHQFIIWHYYL